MDYSVEVVVEEDIYTFEAANNGAGPLWCHGSTIVARWKDGLYVVVLETLEDHVPLNNCRWVLYHRDQSGWQRVHADDTGRTREPSPLVILDDGQLVVSANPTLTDEGAYSGPARPMAFVFDGDNPRGAHRVEYPAWREMPAFSEHSYRTVVADAQAGQVLYMQNVGYDSAHMSLRDRTGAWRGIGQIVWPRGDEYEDPQPLRLCYPNVVLRGGSAHFLGVGDIVEPVAAWREEKFRQSGREWDYVFRRLFYATTPDMANAPFGPWVELVNLDATAGAVRSGDIHVDDSGLVHVLWSQTNADARLRSTFFPDVEIEHALFYATLRDGQVVSRVPLAKAGEGGPPVPQVARFHHTPDGRVFVLASFAGVLRLGRLYEGRVDWRDVPLERPLVGTFVTATQRAGNAPSNQIDIVGQVAGQDRTLSYAQIRVK